VLPTEHIPNLLESPERTQRFTGIKLARLRGEQEYAETIREVAGHPEEDLYVAIEGAIYLASVCGESAQTLLGPYLMDPDEQMQLEAVVSLAETGTSEAVEMLAAILDRTDAPFFLRSAAAWALGKIGTSNAANRLIRAFSDVDRDIREEALESVCSLGDPALENLVAGLVNRNQNIAAGSAEAIRRQVTVPPEIISRIVGEVKADVQRVWAVWLLGHLSHQRQHVATAIADLQDSHPEVHYTIAVLWAFVESWIARHWELHPTAGISPDEV
jgi:hypothetical protein